MIRCNSDKTSNEAEPVLSTVVSMSIKTVTLCATLLASSLTLSACGYDGKYRYPCQDPANHEAPECVPPQCLATGACSDVLTYGEPDA